jgi:transposase
MRLRSRIVTQVLGVPGWKVREAFFETVDGRQVEPVRGFKLPAGTRLVLRVERQWATRCSHCSAIGQKLHEQLKPRRWLDLPWGGHRVEIEAAPVRIKCRRCECHRVEYVPWADPHQRQTRRLQQHLTLEAASMPVMHVAALHGLSWSTVRRAEGAALARWDATRAPVPLRMVGVDEKWLGRRHKLDFHYVTIVSNLETGEPIWIGPDRRITTLSAWLATLSVKQKADIQLFAMDMHDPFRLAIEQDPALGHAAVVHDPFHVMKRAGEAVDEMRRAVFFRAGPELRQVGRGSRWLLLRAWERSSIEQREKLKSLLAYNYLLARTYQIKEELREVVLHAPDRPSMEIGLRRILRRTQAHCYKALRKLHDSLVEHLERILALGEHRPPTGRIEALNNNWETLVRRGRGYRDYPYLLLKLRFMTANPVRSTSGVQRFLALGLPAPLPKAA